MENVSIINADILTHNNWRIIENKLVNKLFSKKKLIFITFCEMYFYKGGKALQQDWVGIIHDPENTHLYYDKKNITRNIFFVRSLPYCKGLFCMSNNLKNWIIKEIKPKFFTDVLYHPLSSKKLEEFQMEKYISDRCIVQIGNWLRKTYAIFKINTNIRKEIIPWNDRTMSELEYFLKRDNISLTEKEENSVIKILPVSDEYYNKIFSNKIIFLDLYSSTVNNVILECIKSNNPIIINRLEPIETYLGKEYPLFYNNLSEVSSLLEKDDLILEAVNYLKNMDKNIFSFENMVDNINNSLSKLYI